MSSNDGTFGQTHFRAVLTVNETAEFLRCSRGHIYNLLSQGELRFVRVGHRTLFRKDDLLSFIERNTTAYTRRQKRREALAVKIQGFMSALEVDADGDIVGAGPVSFKIADFMIASGAR